MKLTKWEAEFLLDEVDRAIRRCVSQQKSTKSLDKLREKLSNYLSMRGISNK
jgi:hypothetical protein